MKKLVLAILLLGIAVARGQGPQPSIEYVLTVTAQDVGTLGQALGELPYRASAQLVAKLNAQIAQQDAARFEAAKPKPAEPKPEETK